MATMTKSERDQRNLDLAAVVWATLGKVADKEGNRTALVDGSSTPVSLDIYAKIDRHKIVLGVEGQLNVGHAQTVNSSSACDQAHLVGFLLAQMPHDSRVTILSTLPRQFLESGGYLPAVDEITRSMAETLLKQLRARSQQKRLGSVSFERTG